MFRNYFTIAWRNLLKNKTFSFINLMGLAIGMACSLLIFLWVKDEYSVDAFHAHKNQLFRIYERQYFDGKMQAVIWTQGPLAEELKKKIPEIEMATAYEWPSVQTFAVGDKMNKQSINAVGPDFFRMFSFKMLHGTPATALKELHSLAISRKMAGIFFGSPEAAMGKTIRYDNRKDFTVSAVFENLPTNSSLQFDCLMTWNAYVEDGNDWATGWMSTDPLTFLQLRKDANPAKVEAKLTHFLDTYLENTPDKSKRTELALQPFHEYYLNSNIKGTHMEGGRIQYVRLFSIVAVFILLIACINFMNLSTARSVKRSKEVGVRKVVGAMRHALIKQFMSEAILLTVLAFLISIVIIALLLPAFNQVTAKELVIPWRDYSFWIILTTLIAGTGLIAGSCPALFMSAMNPIRVLKGRFTFSNSSTWFRKGLVVFQFSLSIVLIIGMIVINRQVHFIQTTNLGYDRENLVYFPIEGDMGSKFDILKQKLLRIPAVKHVSFTTETPVSHGWGQDGVSWEGKDPNTIIRFTPIGAGYDFIKTMGLQLTEGREFSKEFADTSAIVVNEFAVKTMGYKDPIGKTVYLGKYKTTIVGVIKDFHLQSLHTPIRPAFVYLRNLHPEGSVLVRIEAGKTPQALTQLEKIYKEVNPAAPFSPSFADQQYEYLYKNEQVVSSLANDFAAIAIFVSCLGLLGLSMFTAEQRRKEIGIRKVLGANIHSLFTLLSKDFLVLVVIAFLVATPLAWMAAGNWLENFAYRVSVDWWMFAFAGVIAMVIALATISFQTIKAAIANPVKSLRAE